MNLVRAFFIRHRAIALVVVLAALCMKALVPTGYMIGSDSRVITVRICNDGLGHAETRQLVIPMKDVPGDPTGKHGKADGACPFTALSMASVSGADPGLLAIALVFILALAFAPARTALPTRVFYLRPPLRGPPAFV